MSSGYNQELFLNPQDIQNYICSICLDVFNNATSISCDADHLFCEYCLLKYYGRNTRGKSCPQCQQKGLKKNEIQKRPFTNRIIASFKVKCPNQLKEEKEKAQIGECKWTSCLSELDTHLSNYCILTLVKCSWCNKEKKRFQIEDHNNICPRKLVPCNLECGQDIPRQDIAEHIDNDCIHKEVLCFHCHQSFKRYECDAHNDECIEAPIQCPFAIYGCNVYIKQRSLDKHMKKEQLKHLQMKIASFEDKVERLENTVAQLNKQQEEHKEATKHTSNNLNSLTIKVHRSSELQSQVVNQQILMIVERNKLRICDIQSKSSIKLNIPKFSPGYYNCIAKNVSFVTASNMGFPSFVLDFNGNDLLIGVARNGINITNIKLGTNRYFNCSIKSRSHSVIYSKKHGLIIAGGRMRSDENVQNTKLDAYKFSNSSLVHSSLSNSLLNHGICSTTFVNDYYDKLFVCGGCWNKRNLSNVTMYDFKSGRMTKLSNMKTGFQSAGICQWKERGNKIIIGGGFSSNKFVNEYDATKNVWTLLPSLNEIHPSNPLLLPSNNVLYCLGGYKHEFGTIEMYDPRDFRNKWVVIDSVRKYFNISDNIIVPATRLLFLAI